MISYSVSLILFLVICWPVVLSSVPCLEKAFRGAGLCQVRVNFSQSRATNWKTCLRGSFEGLHGEHSLDYQLSSPVSDG